MADRQRLIRNLREASHSLRSLADQLPPDDIDADQLGWHLTIQANELDWFAEAMEREALAQ